LQSVDVTTVTVIRLSMEFDIVERRHHYDVSMEFDIVDGHSSLVEC